MRPAISRIRLLLALLLALPIGNSAQAGEPLSFELDVQPVLTAAGCNSGACHGKSRGQNGFQLSLLGFDPDFDHSAIVEEARGRRIFPAAPASSLLLSKATAVVPHGGGPRLKSHDAGYELIRQWIEAALPGIVPASRGWPELPLQKPTPASFPASGGCGVSASYSDGSSRDVTPLASFLSSDPAVARIVEPGQIALGQIPGEATIMVRYMGRVATWSVSRPFGTVDARYYESLPRRNFVDELVWKKLASLGLRAAARSDDATFHRRAWVSLIGCLPPPDETRAFLGDASPAKRDQLIDHLLERPEFADYWANQWADLLRPNPYRVGFKPTMVFDAWLREAFRENRPFDRFVREIVTAEGSTWHDGPTVLYRDRRTPEEVATLTAQVFLGVRLECARCHDHPFEAWRQDDFYGLAACFARVGRKGPGLVPPISGSEEFIFSVTDGEVIHPRSGSPVPPKPLFGKASFDGDRREALACWLTSDENPYFAEAAVNRLWAAMMGRGLVEPVDDLRATNPPSNPELLRALAASFRQLGYDSKQLLRTIATSHVFGLSSQPAESSAGDMRNFARHYRRRLRAETLWDAVVDITGTPEPLSGMPPESRAMEIWTHRVGSLFLDSFSRPDANQDTPCLRSESPTVVQTLHLLNSPQIERMICHDHGRAAMLAASDVSPRKIIDELYLRCYGRLPREQEFAAALELFSAVDRRQAIEDLMWALLNTPEFSFED